MEVSPEIGIFKKIQLRDLLNKLEIIEDSGDTGIGAVKGVHQVLTDLRTLEDQFPVCNRIEKADETILDSTVLRTACSLVLRSSENVDVNESSYEGTEFASKIIQSTQESSTLQAIGFLNLLSDANEIMRDVPYFSPLFGAFDASQLPAPPTQIKQRQKRKLNEPQAVKKFLKKVDKLEEEEQGIDEIINHMLDVLKNEYEKNNSTPVDYYTYVIDSEDFNGTVENIFYASFLVRDGKAKIEIDENGQSTLVPAKKRDLKRFREENGKNTQLITSITMNEWKRLAVREGHLQRYKRRK